jgi:hypothetical protein
MTSSNQCCAESAEKTHTPLESKPSKGAGST